MSKKKGQKKRPRRRRDDGAAFVCPCAPSQVFAPRRPSSPGFLPKAPSRFCPFPSFHMATGNFFTHKDIFVREKTQKEGGGRRILGKALTWARKEKKRKMESLKPATCVKTFRHSFVHAPFPSPAFPCPYSLERGETSDERRRGEGTTGTGT